MTNYFGSLCFGHAFLQVMGWTVKLFLGYISFHFFESVIVGRRILIS